MLSKDCLFEEEERGEGVLIWGCERLGMGQVPILDAYDVPLILSRSQMMQLKSGCLFVCSALVWRSLAKLIDPHPPPSPPPKGDLVLLAERRLIAPNSRQLFKFEVYKARQVSTCGHQARLTSAPHFLLGIVVDAVRQGGFYGLLDERQKAGGVRAHLSKF